MGVVLGSSVTFWALLCVMERLFVCEDRNHRIQMFIVDGKFWHTFGSSGNGNAQFIRPSGVAVSAGGEVLVCESNGHRVQVFG